MKCVISGGTGFIGRHLADRLREAHEIVVWNRELAANPSPELIEGADAVIQLAGEPVAQRWNGEIKRRIHDSRVLGTRSLVNAIAGARRKPGVLVCASAVGIYGDRGDEVLTEASVPGTGFLAGVCEGWEAEANRASQFGVRVVKLRIGFVLGKGGGALAKMVPAFQRCAGGRLGSGTQWMPWIHIDDVTEMAVHAMENKAVSGVWNATAPEPVRNADFTTALAHAVKRPAVIPVPAFALRLAFGEFGQHMLDSGRVIPDSAVKAGFKFRYPHLNEALSDLI